MPPVRILLIRSRVHAAAAYCLGYLGDVDVELIGLGLPHRGGLSIGAGWRIFYWLVTDDGPSPGT